VKPGDARLVGAGGEVERVPAGRFTPRVAFDVWRNPDRTSGLRGEAAATIGRTADDWARFSIAIGGKSRGYLPGYPLAPAAYVSLGGRVRF
jgi:hypothetical protein